MEQMFIKWYFWNKKFIFIDINVNIEYTLLNWTLQNTIYKTKLI